MYSTAQLQSNIQASKACLSNAHCNITKYIVLHKRGLLSSLCHEMISRLRVGAVTGVEIKWILGSLQMSFFSDAQEVNLLIT